MKKNKNFAEIINYKKNLLDKVKLFEKKIDLISNKIFQKLNNGGKILICGNGGSAADSQHLAAEMLVRLRPNINRKPIPAISLAQDSSTLTACGNDYNFDQIFSRNLFALGNSNDILLVISTSGNSKNIINVLKASLKKKIFTVGLLGNKGGKAKKFCNQHIIVPSSTTARIQEIHIFLGHIILENVEVLSIPFFEINHKFKDLDQSKTYLLYCDK